MLTRPKSCVSVQQLKSVSDLRPVHYDENVVEEVYSFKYLGIVLDPRISFDLHVKYMRKKVFANMKPLGRIHPYISQSLAIQFYKSLVLPDFDYADQVYDAMSETNAKQLQIIQNTCLRICTNSLPRTSATVLHAETAMPTLSVRRKIHTCNLVHLGLTNNSSAGLSNMFHTSASTDAITTQATSAAMLEVPKTKLRVTEGNVRTRGAIYFNQLPYDIRTTVKHDTFKSSNKAFFVNNT